MTNNLLYDSIITLLRTEKATAQEPFRKYLFLVTKDTNKILIKKAVEDIYKVKVQSVNTKISPGKIRRVRFKSGYETNKKKALVTLKEGYKIETS